MKRSELYAHKSDYEKIIAFLSEYKALPCVEDALSKLSNALNICRHFEKWHIDVPYWDDMIDRLDKVDIYTCPCSRIPNQREEFTDDGDYSTYPLELDPPQDFLVIRFACGAYMFGEDYPTELFEEMYAELKMRCPPKYEDRINNCLYYTPDSAASAYETCMKLCAEYRVRYGKDATKRKIANLERELAKLQGEAE